MTQYKPNSRTSRARAAAAFLLAASLCGGGAHAQWVVIDPTSIQKDVAEYAQQLERWKSTFEQYQKQYAHYQQQLIKLQRLNLGQSAISQNFAERALDYGMEQECSGASGGGISGMISQVLPNIGGNIVEEQKAVCQRIVMAENAKYNETVRMLRRLVERNNQFKAVEQQRDSVGSSQGALAANDNEVQRFASQNEMDFSYWDANMKAYDSYIAALKGDQSRLSKRALDGDKDTLTVISGQIVQSAVLAGALYVPPKTVK